MRLLKLTTLLVLIFFTMLSQSLALSQKKPSFKEHKPRSMWVWDKYETVKKILLKKKYQRKFFEFCQNPRDNLSPPITKVYLDAHDYPSEYAPMMARFIQKAHDKGMEVHYLGGDPSWAVIDPEITLKKVRRVLAYNQTHPKIESFDGIHFDIEPYLLPIWEKEYARIGKDYINLLTAIKKEIDFSDNSMVFGVAIPVFFSEKDRRGGFLTAKIQDIVDYVAVMDYRDKGERIIADGEIFIKEANKIGKGVVLGVETMDVVSAGEGTDYLSFYEEGVKYMEKELIKVEEAFYQEKSYQGIAIHYYNSYQKMPIEYTKKAIKVPELNVIRRPNPIKIDGEFDDWKKIPAEVMAEEKLVVFKEEDVQWGNIKNLSANFQLCWDEDYLYLATTVKDDNLIITKKGSGANMWMQDHIETWFAPDPDYNSKMTDKYQIGFSPGNQKEIKPFYHIWLPKKISPEKIKFASKHRLDGYQIEVAFPLKLLNLNIISGTKIRFLLDLGDADTKENQQDMLMSLSKNRKWGDPLTFAILTFK